MIKQGLFVSAFVFAAACNGDTTKTSGTSGDTGTTTTTTTTPPPATGNVRLIHLSPDAGAVDVFLDGAEPAALAGVEYLDGIDYIALPVGDHTFDVAPAGLGIGATVLSATVTVEEGVNYSAAAYGTIANGDIGVAALVDDSSGLIAGNSRYQVTHAASGVGQVDVIAVDLATAIITDLDFGATTSLDLPAAAYNVGIDATNDGVSEFVFAVPALGADIFVDVYAVADTEGAKLVAHLPDGTVAVVAANPPAM
jgi:Domain of unknown function (DUF4397)